MKSRNLIISCIVAIVLMQVSSVAMADRGKGKKGKGKGRPFTQISSQIVEIQTSILSLRAELDAVKAELDAFKEDVDIRFQSVEDKIGAIDLKIGDLEEKDKSLAGSIRELLATATSNRAAIDQIMTTIRNTNTQIATIRADIITLKTADSINQELIKENEASIALLEKDIADAYVLLDAEVQGLTTLLNEKLGIHEFVTALNQYKIEVQEAFDRKQDIINATCADGEFLSNVQPDGSFECKSPITLANGVTRTTVYSAWIPVPHLAYVKTGTYQQEYNCGGWINCYRTVSTYGYVSRYASATVSCPVGHILASDESQLTAPAYRVNPVKDTKIHTLADGNHEGIVTKASNDSISENGSVRAVATCFGVN